MSWSILKGLIIITKLCLLAVLFSHFSIYASIKTPLPLEDYFKETWTTHDGLPHNSIHALTQTKDGYLWIATWEGLVRFNGREFKVFPRISALGLPSAGVLSLATKADGSLLVAGARGGISERKNRLWSAHKPVGSMVNDIIYDNEQGYWLSPENEGLIYRDSVKNQDTLVIPKIRVYDLLQEGNKVWVATSTGLYHVINKKAVKHYDASEGLLPIRIFKLLLTRDKALIIATDQGLYIFKDNTFKPFIPELKDKRVYTIFQDSNDDIWIGTMSHGVYRFSVRGLEHLDDKDGLPHNRVSIIYEDQENSIWIGTNSGLLRLREAPFVTLTRKQGLQGNYIRTVMSHSNGSLWVGSSKGLNRINGRKITNITSNKPVYVLSLAEGTQGDVLVGSYNQGLFKVIDGHLQRLESINQYLPSKEIRSILVDSKNTLWVGTAGGLVQVDSQNNVSYFDKKVNLPNNYVMAITEDKLGRIWFGTRGGVAVYEQGKIKTYPIKEKFDARFVFGLFVDGNIIWMATDRGLIKLNPATEKMVIVRQENGLHVDKIFQVIIDNERNFWLTSNRGVIKFNEYEIYKVISDAKATIEYELFTEGDGLLSSQANGGSTPSATLHTDGSIWVATAKGLSQATPERLRRIAEKKIPVIIEELIVDGKNYPLSKNKTITLPKGSSRLTIYYAGIGFLNAKHIQYQTQLVGFDQQWLDKNNKTYSEYTNLEPGQYSFKMRAKYPNGQWQGQVATLHFTIEAYFWQTQSFKIFVVVFFLLSAYLAYRYRLSQVTRSEQRLKRLVAKQTRDLQKQAESFAYQATHDQLTGLPNRRAFDAWCDVDFKQAKENGNSLSLAILDIDRFKRINDGFSHLVGDEVIKIVANILKNMIKTSTCNVKLARWGGEEFTLLIEGDKDEAYEFCESVRQYIADYDFSQAAKGLHITVSIGLTDNKAVSEYDKMICRADQALYYAKHHGRNQVRIFQRFIDDALCKPKPRL